MKKFGKIAAAAAFVVFAVAFTSCTSLPKSTQSAGNKSYYSTISVLDSVNPLAKADSTKLAAPKNYEVLGPVSVEASSSKVLGIVFTNDSFTYAAILDAAKKQYPDCDAVINIKRETSNSLNLGFYIKDSGYMTGTAINITETLVSNGTVTSVTNANGIVTTTVTETKVLK